MPETPGQYAATGAPLVVKDLVISGIAGGDGPLRGFVAAYKATTGQQAWRYWTIPKPGDPVAETWSGTALATGGGATWATGSYDVETDTLYWAVGNPFPATEGDERVGTNLYTDCYWPWTRRMESSSGTFNSRRMTFMIGMLRNRSFLLTLPTADKIESCSCKRIAMDSSTFSIGRTANCSSANRL